MWRRDFGIRDLILILERNGISNPLTRHLSIDLTLGDGYTRKRYKPEGGK